MLQNGKLFTRPLPQFLDGRKLAASEIAVFIDGAKDYQLMDLMEK